MYEDFSNLGTLQRLILHKNKSTPCPSMTRNALSMTKLWGCCWGRMEAYHGGTRSMNVGVNPIVPKQYLHTT